ncbi:hypothetical protein XELAEV_18017761mg [Xenopus laevis]|uniref:Uncharacterized protein n=1 Tax=Xenopus laevis TaxID=8355 RepID=A0A974DC14_XENLA|nr:hypothetical protein XELAEV_18017761mg [Xenopus laevis]
MQAEPSPCDLLVKNSNVLGEHPFCSKKNIIYFLGLHRIPNIYTKCCLLRNSTMVLLTCYDILPQIGLFL